MEAIWRQLFPCGVVPSRMLGFCAANCLIDVESPVLAAFRRRLSMYILTETVQVESAGSDSQIEQYSTSRNCSSGANGLPQTLTEERHVHMAKP
ncbi:hypothetical protein ZWY2020_026080 [Hordeum vulgare]|nr:hypothetical protein ZWY2020_026080 [Hordeum vulgare]